MTDQILEKLIENTSLAGVVIVFIIVILKPLVLSFIQKRNGNGKIEIGSNGKEITLKKIYDQQQALFNDHIDTMKNELKIELISIGKILEIISEVSKQTWDKVNRMKE